MNITSSKCFSSGPCKKRPNWSYDIFRNSEVIGRSHRSKVSKILIKEIIDLQKELLQLPQDYLLGIFTGSDTGAFETALWNMIGKIGVDVIEFENFSKNWKEDIVKILNIKDVNVYTADYGSIPNTDNINGDRDVVFVYNGTTSGVCFDNLDFIKKDRKGLTFCDATSIAFATEIDYSKIDVLTYSWQKVLGGEAGFGILILSPRAVERINEYIPENRPIPKIYRIKKDGKLNLEIFEGSTINTISMLCVEDFKDTLLWAKNNGGLDFLINKTKINSDYLYNFIDNSEYLETLCKEKKYRSPTSVCFSIKDKYFGSLEEKQKTTKEITSILDSENIACDINSYKTAPTGFRIWCGPTVELDDIKIVCEWIDKILKEKI